MVVALRCCRYAPEDDADADADEDVDADANADADADEDADAAGVEFLRPAPLLPLRLEFGRNIFEKFSKLNGIQASWRLVASD